MFRNWQRKFNIKIWLSAVKKNNKVALKYNKYLGWNKLKEDSELLKEIKRRFTSKGFNFYLRNNNDKKF